jgi:hypothetical protein
VTLALTMRLGARGLLMRAFRDSSGNEWTVFEVRRQVSTNGDLVYMPQGFGSGWLCFENGGGTAKRRLVRFPERWREFGDAELEKLLGQAQPAPRGTFRLADDLSPRGGHDLRPE